MKLHPRAMLVRKAGRELGDFIDNLAERYDLTVAEVTRLLAERILEAAFYEIRAERHPNDPDKKGDEA